MDAASVVPNNESGRLLHSSFGGRRLFTCIALDQLAVGMTVLVFGFYTPDAPADSVAGLVTGYVVVNRLPGLTARAMLRALILSTAPWQLFTLAFSPFSRTLRSSPSPS